MAGIRNTISIQDRMTPVFSKIIRAMDSTLQTMARLDTATKNQRGFSSAFNRANADIKAANNELIKMKNSFDSLDAAAKSAGNLSGELNNIQNISKNTPSFFNLANIASAVYLVKQVGSELSKIIQASDEMRSIQARIGRYNETGFSDQALFSQVYKTAIASRTGVQPTGEMVSRLLTAGIFQGPDAALAATDLAGIINKATVASGATTEESRRALLQLSQGLSSGVLQGDELRSIREQVPYLADIIAEGLGEVDSKFKNLGIGDLKELGKQGELTSDRIVKAFLAMRPKIEADMKKMPKTWGQVMNNIQSTALYAISLLSQTGGPIDSLVGKLDQFSEALIDPKNAGAMQTMAFAISLVVFAFSALLDGARIAYEFIGEHSEEAKFAILGLAAAALTYGAISLVSFGIAHPILLAVIASILLLTKMLSDLGVGADKFFGAVSQGAVGLFTPAWNYIADLVNLVISVWEFIVNVSTNNSELLGAALTILFIRVGQAIVSNFLTIIDTITGWINTVSNLIPAIPKIPMAAPGFNDLVNTQVQDTIDRFNVKSDDDFKKLDRMPYLDELSGNKAGKETEDWINKLNQYANVAEDLFTKYDPTKFFPSDFSVNINGGNLDSVGKIKDTVDISEEDIRLMRDIVARDYLIQMNSLAPSVSAVFGDVKQSADVKEIMGILTQMIEEAAATNLRRS